MIRTLSAPTATPLRNVAGERRLLVISCSQQKVGTPGRIPALRRYDGPAFRVLRKYLLSARDPHLRVFILSAKYGLIPAHKCISDYNLRLDAKRAAFLRPTVTRGLGGVLTRLRPKATLLCMSKLYLTCFGDLCGLEIAARGQGRKLAHLKSWLYNT